MSFWIVTAGITLIVSAFIALAMRRPDIITAQGAAEYDVRVYRDQLREVERDLERGIIAPAQAEQLRTEISRRILSTDTRTDKQAQNGIAPASKITIAAVGATLFCLAFLLYAQLGAPQYEDQALKDRIEIAKERRATRPSQQAFEATLPASAGLTSASDEYLDLITKLRDAVAQRPDDIQGHALLARNEANLGNYSAAARALGAIVQLKGADAAPQDFIDHADMLIIAAGGYVSPEAEKTLNNALAIDPENGTARYYIGLMMAQTGRPDIAFRIWQALLKTSAPEDVWTAPIRSQIEQMAQLAGVAYELPQVAVSQVAGPTQDDIEAAGEMDENARSQMIEGMVARLSDTLATSGGPVEKWVQLIGALGVLERTDQARAIWENAQDVFAGDEAALNMLRGAAIQAGALQ